MSAVRAMMMLRELAPEYVKRVDAIGISGHMLGCLPMDKEGQTLRPSIIHADTRALAISNALRARFGRDYFYEICGSAKASRRQRRAASGSAARRKRGRRPLKYCGKHGNAVKFQHGKQQEGLALRIGHFCGGRGNDPTILDNFQLLIELLRLLPEHPSNFTE